MANREVKLIESQERIEYVIQPHSIRRNMEVVTILCDGELVATFYMHSSAGRRFAVVMSKHLQDAYIDKANPLAPGLMIDLGEVPIKVKTKPGGENGR